MIRKFEQYDLQTNFDDERKQVITKHLVQAAHTYKQTEFRVIVKDFFGERLEYSYDFGMGNKIKSEELERVNPQNRLHIIYYDVYTGEIGLPEVKQRSAEITIIAKTDDGQRSITMEDTLYRKFAEAYIKALRHFETRIFEDAIVRNGKPYSY